jgi:protein-tyrosine-phosphatase
MSKTILFVCRGNAFRSILADAYLKSKQLSNIKVLSAGTVATQYYEQNGVDFNAHMADYAAAHGIGNFIKDHYGDQLTQELLDSAANITGSITSGKFLVDKLY